MEHETSNNGMSFLSPDSRSSIFIGRPSSRDTRNPPLVPRLALLVLFSLLLAGCQTPSPHPHAKMPTYEELVDRYNANLAGLDRLWARAIVELRWREDGKKHFEQGDGHLIIILPDRLALPVGKLGKTMYWAGGDGQRYWVLDLREQRIAFVGSHEHFDSTKTRLPVHPIDLPKLLGIVSIPRNPRNPRTPSGSVRWQAGRYVIAPTGTNCQFHLHPKSILPTRIELFDDEGKPRIVANLSKHSGVGQVGAAPGGRPLIATRVKVQLTTEAGSLTLYLSAATNDPSRFNPKAFDFEHLKKVHRIEEVIDLDPARMKSET